MYFHFPDIRRCCICVPLRYGILIFGYLNLWFALVVITSEHWLDMIPPKTDMKYVFNGVAMHTRLWFFYLLYALEIIFSVVLLIGAHLKNHHVIRVYYYYGIVTTLASFLTCLLVRRVDRVWYTNYFQFCLTVSGLAVRCYLLLLIRTELHKQRYQTAPVRYVNQVAEVVVDPPPPGEKNLL